MRNEAGVIQNPSPEYPQLDYSGLMMCFVDVVSQWHQLDGSFFLHQILLSYLVPLADKEQLDVEHWNHPGWCSLRDWPTGQVEELQQLWGLHCKSESEKNQQLLGRRQAVVCSLPKWLTFNEGDSSCLILASKTRQTSLYILPSSEFQQHWSYKES